MKRITLTICAAALLLTACNNAAKNESTTDSASATSSTDESKDKPWVPVDSATMMKAMMEYGTPGPAHERLAKSNGNWTATIVSWWGEGGKADSSVGSVTNKMFDNLHQVSNFSGTMMGMPFKGMSTTGYDNYKKVYVTTWIDTWSSGIMQLEGPWDEATKSMTLTGKMTSPVDGRMCEMKQVYKYVDDNTEVMEMYGPDPQTGNQFKNMVITFKRAK